MGLQGPTSTLWTWPGAGGPAHQDHAKAPGDHCTSRRHRETEQASEAPGRRQVRVCEADSIRAGTRWATRRCWAAGKLRAGLCGASPATATGGATTLGQGPRDKESTGSCLGPQPRQTPRLSLLSPSPCLGTTAWRSPSCVPAGWEGDAELRAHVAGSYSTMGEPQTGEQGAAFAQNPGVQHTEQESPRV